MNAKSNEQQTPKIANFEEMFSTAKGLAKDLGPKRLAVAQATNEDVLEAVRDAYEAGLVRALLTGERQKILALMHDLNTVSYTHLTLPTN